MNKLYCGKGKQIKNWLTGINVCLDDIPSEHIITAKNGKRYVNLDVCEHKQGVDKYGNSHYVAVNTYKTSKKSDKTEKSVQEVFQGEIVEDPGKDPRGGAAEDFKDDIPF